jgi:hypothetical protein
MSKVSILITNIFIGLLFAFVLFSAVYGMTYMGTGITGQCFIGFLLTSSMLAVMWSETTKMNDDSIVFLGGPILSGSTSLPFYAIASQEPGFSNNIETAYMLLAFVLFYFLVQIGMYYMVKRKQKKI